MTEDFRGGVGAAVAPSSGKVIGDIEILRGVAICMVLIAHLPYNLLWWGSAFFQFALKSWNGSVGVDLFFAVSGFVIARTLLPQLERSHADGNLPSILAAFWLRRAFRLLPAAWLWLALPLACSYRFNAYGTFGDFDQNLSQSFDALLNVANVAFAHSHPNSGTARVYWSLSLEEQFYLVLPVLIILFRRKLPWVMGAFVAYQFFMPAGPLANLTRPGALAVGVLIAMASRRPWYRQIAPTVLEHSGMLRLIVTGLILAALGRLATGVATVNLGVVAALAGFLVFAASYDRFSIWPDKHSAIAMRWLGSRSYALYLTHMTSYSAVKLVVVARFGFIPPQHVWLDSVVIAAAVLLALLLAEATHRLVEIPCRSYGRRLTRNLGNSTGISAALSTSGNTAT